MADVSEIHEPLMNFHVIYVDLFLHLYSLCMGIQLLHR